MGILLILLAVAALGWMCLAVFSGAASLVNTAMLFGTPVQSRRISGKSTGTAIQHTPQPKPAPPPRALPDGARALLRLLEEQHAKHH